MQIQGSLSLNLLPLPVYITQVIVRKNDLTPTALEALCNKCSNRTSIIMCFLEDATYFICIHLSQITARKIHISVLPTVHIRRRSLCGQQSYILDKLHARNTTFHTVFHIKGKIYVKGAGVVTKTSESGKNRNQNAAKLEVFTVVRLRILFFSVMGNGLSKF